MQKRIGSMELMSQCPQYSPYRRHYEITALMSPGNQSALKGINGDDDCVTKNKPYRRGNSMIKLSSNLMNVDKKQLFNKNNYVISNSINKSQSIDSAFDKYDILLNLDTDENNVNTSIDINDFELISMDDIDILRGVIDDVNVPENIVDDFDILYEKKLFETDFKDEKINCLDDFIDDNTEMILNDDYSHAMEQSSQILKKNNYHEYELQEEQLDCPQGIGDCSLNTSCKNLDENLNLIALQKNQSMSMDFNVQDVNWIDKFFNSKINKKNSKKLSMSQPIPITVHAPKNFKIITSDSTPELFETTANESRIFNKNNHHNRAIPYDKNSINKVFAPRASGKKIENKKVVAENNQLPIMSPLEHLGSDSSATVNDSNCASYNVDMCNDNGNSNTNGQISVDANVLQKSTKNSHIIVKNDDTLKKTKHQRLNKQFIKTLPNKIMAAVNAIRRVLTRCIDDVEADILITRNAMEIGLAIIHLMFVDRYAYLMQFSKQYPQHRLLKKKQNQ